MPKALTTKANKQKADRALRIERFLEEYLRNGLNASGAYAAVFPKVKKSSAYSQGTRFLQQPAVQARLNEVMAAQIQDVEVKVNDLIRETLQQAFFNPAEYMKIDDDGRPVIDLTKCFDKPDVMRLLNIEFGVSVTKDGDKIHTYKVTPRDKDAAMERLFKLKRLYLGGEDAGNGRPITVNVNFPVPASGWRNAPPVIDADDAAAED